MNNQEVRMEISKYLITFLKFRQHGRKGDGVD